MRKKIILVIAFTAVAVLFLCGFIFLSYNPKTDDESIKVGERNIPYPVRERTSYVISKTYIQSLYGKPNVVRNAGKYSYEIRNMNDGSKLFVVYNSKNDVVQDIWRLKELLSPDSFNNIEVNKSTFDDVKKIDTYSQNFIPPTGEAISEHRLSNSKAIIIHYTKKSNQYIVNSIKQVSDPSNFASIILPEDLNQLLPQQ